MTEPTDAELDAVLCNQWPAFSMQATLVRAWVRAAMRDALAKWGTQPVPAGYALVPVEPTPEMLSEIWVHKNGSLSEAYRAMLAAAPQPTQPQAGVVPTREFLERTLAAMEGVIDVADRKTDEFDALRSCVIDLTLMLFSDAKRHTKEADHER